LIRSSRLHAGKPSSGRKDGPTGEGPVGRVRSSLFCIQETVPTLAHDGRLESATNAESKRQECATPMNAPLSLQDGVLLSPMWGRLLNDGQPASRLANVQSSEAADRSCCQELGCSGLSAAPRRGGRRAREPPGPSGELRVEGTKSRPGLVRSLQRGVVEATKGERRGEYRYIYR
jgi:hypothetical protein